MNNPNNIDKYPNIPFGQFQALINHCEKMDYSEYCESEIDKGEIPMSYELWMELNTPYKKTVLETCEVESVYIDDELEFVDCYYRFIDGCPNAQTDREERLLTIEAVKKDGEEIKLSETDYLNACESILHRIGQSNHWHFNDLRA